MIPPFLWLVSMTACTPPSEGPPPEAPAAVAPKPEIALTAGSWRAELTTPGGPLPFGIDLSDGNGTWQAWLINGEERIAVDRVDVKHGTLVLGMDRYDAQIEARFVGEGTELEGTWRKTRAAGTSEQLPFRATSGRSRRFEPLRVVGDPRSVTGRWRADFESEDDVAVGLFDQVDGGTDVSGTFLTPTGDYRFLAGSMEADTLRLSAFDGAHAFLFQATLDAEGALAGDFWSGASWHETWTATLDPDVVMPDPYGMTRVTEDLDWSKLRFTDLDGKERGLDDPAWAGSPRLIQLMGTWCPNCNDQSELLVELHRRYHGQGLKFLSLAFEYSGDPKRDGAVVRRYREVHGAPWTYLVAGLSDKEAASKAVPFLDRVRAYPTLLFVDRDGVVKAVHTGFVGPAAPEEHLELRAGYDRLIREILTPAKEAP